MLEEYKQIFKGQAKEEKPMRESGRKEKSEK